MLAQTPAFARTHFRALHRHPSLRHLRPGLQPPSGEPATAASGRVESPIPSWAFNRRWSLKSSPHGRSPKNKIGHVRSFVLHRLWVDEHSSCRLGQPKQSLPEAKSSSGPMKSQRAGPAGLERHHPPEYYGRVSINSLRRKIPWYQGKYQGIFGQSPAVPVRPNRRLSYFNSWDRTSCFM